MARGYHAINVARHRRPLGRSGTLMKTSRLIGIPIVKISVGATCDQWHDSFFLPFRARARAIVRSPVRLSRSGNTGTCYVAAAALRSPHSREAECTNRDVKYTRARSGVSIRRQTRASASKFIASVDRELRILSHGIFLLPFFRTKVPFTQSLT